jgi:PhoPQ-activated pathogenicity-related protein
VDSRFRAAVPVYGCGYLQENSVWLDRFAKMEPEARERWTTLWDPSRYLPAVSMPIFFVNGTNDFAYPLDSHMKSYDAVSCAKQIRVTVNMPHSHPDGWAPAEIGLFIDSHLRGAAQLPTLTDPRNENGTVQTTCDCQGKLTEAFIHLTTEEGAINNRTWQSLAARVEGNIISVDAPSEATAWFITVSDEKGAIVSSRVMICQPDETAKN